MINAQPFSFDVINALPAFELKKPSFLEVSDHVALAYYAYAAPADKTIVILYAGAGLYGNKTYQWVAKTLQEKHTIGCYIFDLRGHGNSQGERGDAPSVTRVWQDVAESIAMVKKAHPNAKLYLAGHSSGAGLIINYAANADNHQEDGYIFLAPFLGPQAETNRTHADPSKNFITKVRTWVYIAGSIFPNSFFIHKKAIFFNYSAELLAADPLIVADYSYAMSAATTPYDVQPLLKKLNKPVGIYIGKDDEQFLPEKVIAYKDYIPAPTTTEIIENCGHLSILVKAPELIASFIKHN